MVGLDFLRPLAKIVTGSFQMEAREVGRGLRKGLRGFLERFIQHRIKGRLLMRPEEGSQKTLSLAKET